jgi:hypothetical protein
MSETPQATPSENWWSRFWRRLREFEEAMDTSAVEVLHRRISVLEREVAEINANRSEAGEIHVEGDRVG